MNQIDKVSCFINVPRIYYLGWIIRPIEELENLLGTKQSWGC